MCKHSKIYHLGLQRAYCKECKKKIELDKHWTKRYKATVNVDEYKLQIRKGNGEKQP